MPRKPVATPPNDDALPRIGSPATNALALEGVTTLSQVAKWKVSELKALHGVGPKAIRLLAEALAARGTSFAKE